MESSWLKQQTNKTYSRFVEAAEEDELSLAEVFLYDHSDRESVMLLFDESFASFETLSLDDACDLEEENKERNFRCEWLSRVTEPLCFRLSTIAELPDEEEDEEVVSCGGKKGVANWSIESSSTAVPYMHEKLLSESVAPVILPTCSKTVVAARAC